MTPWYAALVALFVWWFSTGLILMMVKRADQNGPTARQNATLASVPLLAAGILGFWWSLPEENLLGVYIAFLSALAIWGWIEISFLTGVITGPSRASSKGATSQGDRFWQAFATVAYHELLLAAVLVALFALAQDAPNIFGKWTFAILFFARISAKLNLFLGVPRVHTDFLPQALEHLQSHFGPRRMSWLFPVSVTGLTAAIFCWVHLLLTTQAAYKVEGFALLTALTALALLEHWVMVLPIPDERLWRWMLPTPKPTQDQKTQGGHHGL